MITRHSLFSPALLLLCASLAAGCASQAPPEPQAAPSQAQPAPPAPRPWTETFMEPAVLVAREVLIEGPAGLRDHVALTIDSEVHDYEVSTSPEGLLQELSVKAGAGDEFVRCQLDRLQIAAEVRVRVLERPGDVPVIVTARGDVVWQTPAGEEKRDATLRFVGQEPR